MKTMTGMVSMLGIGLLAACAAQSDQKPVTLPVATPEMAGLGEVPTQALNRGQCALVLWARRMPPSRIVVSLDKPALARIDVGGKQIELLRVSQRGQPLYGQFPEQHYSGGGVSIGITFTPGDARDISGGAMVSTAIVEYVDANGWASVIPASGLIGCQA